jgi:S1-C subfamily serine protease
VAPRAAVPPPAADRRPPSGERPGPRPEPAPRPRREADEDRPPRRHRDDEGRAPRSRREDEGDRPSRRREDDEDRPSRPRRRPKASRFAAVWFVGGGIAALALLVAGGVWALNRGRDAGPAGDGVQANLVAAKSDASAEAPKAPAKQDPPAKADPQQPPPDGPAPDALSARNRVKQATVLLRVTTADGDRAEGSGFFALKEGLVITNAHVLGMLAKRSKPPREVEVVVNSGRANETKLTGTVFGVDRASDLGIVRVAGAALPAPLPIETKRELVETQKVYIFGFPFGTQLGKDITVSESSISSLRTHGTDTVQQIQVNGGIHPGNSGGPVVNSEGKVIGVSVAVVRGTQINFAVPAHFVSSLATGRISDA